MKKGSVFALVFCVLLLLVNHSAKADVPLKPDYLSTSVEYFDRLSQNYSEAVILTEIQNKNVRWICNYMYSSGIMYQASGQQKYLDRCNYIFTTAMVQWKANSALMSGTDDFFATKHLAYTAMLLKSKGVVGDEYDSVLLNYANKHFQPDFIVDHNQAQERALGFVLMQKLLPGAPNIALWKQYTDACWDFWYKNLDVEEDATNYCAIHVNDIIQIAEESGKSELLKRPEIKKWFDRFRDQQAPSGYMPEYGDDYFPAYFEWIICFERIARLFNDPTYLSAAWKLFHIGFYNLEPAYYKAGSDMKRACEWSQMAAITLLPAMDQTPELTNAASLITTRTNRNGVTNLNDKLLMASSRINRTPFIMSDLYAQGAHAHANLRGTINYYEVDNYPLFHGVERHATDARCGNTVVMLKQEDEGFPFSAGGSRKQTDKWFTDCIDFTPSTQISESDPSMRGFREITFRVRGQIGEEIYIDNVRLVGKKGELMIHTCDNLTDWSSAAALTDDAVSGKAVKITLKNTDVNFVGLKVSKDFSLNDYQYVTIDWKHKVVDEAAYSNLDFMLRVQNKLVMPGEEYVHATVGTMFNLNRVESAFTENVDKDSYGEIILNDHFLPNTQLHRRILLTEEGVLILQDYLIPGEGSDGYTAGSLWQAYKIREKGANWFNSPGENINWLDNDGKAISKELLVYFESQEGRSYGNQQQEYSVLPMVVYAKQAVIPHQPLTFTTILIPHNAGTKAEYYAKNISSFSVGQMSTISLKLHGRQLSIRMNEDRTWSIQREEIPIDPEEESEINILTNGDVSEIAAGVPVDWSAQGNKAYCFYDPDIYRTAAGSLKITGDVNNWRGWRHTDIPVEEGETYRISMYTKTENVAASSRVYVSFGVKDITKASWVVSDNDGVTKSVLVDNVKGTHDWMLIQGEYKIPASGAYISYFTPRFDSNGAAGQIAWYDDFKMVKVKENLSVIYTKKESPDVRVYPNPYNRGNLLRVELPEPFLEESSISLYSSYGQKIAELLPDLHNENILSISLPPVNPGVYYLKVCLLSGELSKKLLVN